MSNNNRFSPPLFFKLIPLRRRWGRCNAFFANNAITSVTHKIHDETYTYDSEGNRVSKQNSTHRELYEWDYRNRLTKVIQQEYNSTTEEWQNVQIVEYAYDYNNIWIRKTLDTNGDGTADSKSIFIPENYQTTVQLDNNTVSHHYLWIPQHQDKLLADTTADGVLWTLTDHLGSIRDILDRASFGIVSLAHIIYDAYGSIISCKNLEGMEISNPVLLGYTGKFFDTDTKLQNNINRWFDAAISRWPSTDPIGFNGNSSNLYCYVGNQVLGYVDFHGLLACEYVVFITDNKDIWNLMHEQGFLKPAKEDIRGKRPSLSGNSVLYPKPLKEDWDIPEGVQLDYVGCWAGGFFGNLPDKNHI